ncbi:response regulator [Parasphingorhabdus sp.]|jgi:two-component system response regulator FixJ|uniref:response regulator transcription factor n=1 Tax=Parasphingorhabdus sp. TaxID=2709688 RepID=UPI0032ED358A
MLQIVFVLDDDDAVREALGTLLQAKGYAVRAYESAEAFLEELNPALSGCILLDVRMPGLSGPELQERLLDMNVSLPVIMITGNADLPTAVKTMKAGAIDFIEKPFEKGALLESVEKALALSAKQHAQAVSTDNWERNLGKLTPRERQVLEQIVQGHPNKIAAFHLGISQRTVEVHRSRIIEKLEARNFSHLIRMAIAAEVLSLDEEPPE